MDKSLKPSIPPLSSSSPSKANRPVVYNDTPAFESHRRHPTGSSTQRSSFSAPGPSSTSSSIGKPNLRIPALPSSSSTGVDGRFTSDPARSEFMINYSSQELTDRLNSTASKSLQTLESLFDRLSEMESVVDLKSSTIDIKLWTRYAFGLLAFEQEKTEHMESVCNHLDLMRLDTEQELASVRLGLQKSSMESERLLDEVKRLNTERDTLIGRTYMLEAKLKDSGTASPTVIHVQENRPDSYVALVTVENTELKAAQVRLESTVTFYENQLATTKVKLATLMDENERLKNRIYRCEDQLKSSPKKQTFLNPPLESPRKSSKLSPASQLDKLKDWAFKPSKASKKELQSAAVNEKDEEKRKSNSNSLSVEGIPTSDSKELEDSSTSEAKEVEESQTLEMKEVEGSASSEFKLNAKNSSSNEITQFSSSNTAALDPPSAGKAETAAAAAASDSPKVSTQSSKLSEASSVTSGKLEDSPGKKKSSWLHFGLSNQSKKLKNRRQRSASGEPDVSNKHKELLMQKAKSKEESSSIENEAAAPAAAAAALEELESSSSAAAAAGATTKTVERNDSGKESTEAAVD